MPITRTTLLGLMVLLGGGGCATIPSDDYDAIQRMLTMLNKARKEYVVQPGDTFRVTVYRGGAIAGQYGQEVTVQPDHKVSLINLESPISTKGLTVQEVQNAIQERYYPFFQAGEQGGGPARMTVQFVSSQKAAWLPDQVYVLGQVRRSQSVPYRRGLTVLQAIAQAGSWVPTADESRVVLLRLSDEGKTITREIDMHSVVSHEGDDMELFAGDVVYVPLSAIARINLWVEFYIRNMLPINPSSVARLAAGI